MPSGGLGFRAYAFFDTLLWIACLNIFWTTFTLLGGVVLGVGPSTAAAHILVRDRVRGNAAPLLKRFAREYFKNFLKGNLLGVPVLLVAVALFLNWSYFSAGWDLGSQVASMAVLLLVLFAAGASATSSRCLPATADHSPVLPDVFALRHAPPGRDGHPALYDGGRRVRVPPGSGAHSVLRGRRLAVRHGLVVRPLLHSQ